MPGRPRGIIGLGGGNVFRHGDREKEISTKLMKLPKCLFVDQPTRRSGASAER
jgi:hypothetical protein